MKRNYILLVLLFLSFVMSSRAGIPPNGGTGGGGGGGTTTGGGATTSSPDFSQYMPTVTPSFPSPQAEAFQIFGQIPVSLYTGTPDISIPLYTLTEGDISVPITLSYHPAARKVNSLPSWVGLGWNLNVGGVITRIVRGSRDEDDSDVIEQLTGVDFPPSDPPVYYKGYMYNTPLWHSSSQDSRYRWRNIVDARDENPSIDCFINVMNNFGGNQPPPCRQIATLDNLPDEFVFNFMGYSGSFFWLVDKDNPGYGEFVVLSNSAIKIVFDENQDIRRISNLSVGGDYGSVNWNNDCMDCEQHIVHFKLITPDGFQYDFGGNPSSFEFSVPRHDNRPKNTVTSAWYLTKITSPKGFEVNFTYNRGENILNIYPYYENIKYNDNIFDCNVISNGGIKCPAETKLRTVEGQIISPVYLQSIEGSLGLGKVEFSKDMSLALNYDDESMSELKVDMVGTHAVANSNCRVDNPIYQNPVYKLNDVQCYYDNQLFKRFDFSYIEENNQRLKLLSIHEIGINNNFEDDSKGSYNFEYNSNTLPPLCSDASDYWGFYNGSGDSYTGSNGSDYFSKKQPSGTPEIYLAEILTKIQYPTGGHSAFEYEVHNYNSRMDYVSDNLVQSSNIAGGVRIKSIKNFDGYSFTSQKEYRYTKYSSDIIGSSTSSGILAGLPTYYYSNTSPYDPHYPIEMFCSGMIMPMGEATTGSHIGYSNVIEIEKDASGAIIGYTVNRFSNYDEDVYGNTHLNSGSGGASQMYSLIQKQYISDSRHFERGKLMLQEKYNDQGKIVEKQQKKYHLYNYSNPGYNVFDFISTCGIRGYEVMDIGSLHICYGNYLPIWQNTVKYYYTTNQKDSIEEIKFFGYNYDLLLSSEKTILASGDTLETAIKYSGEYDVPTIGWNGNLMQPEYATEEAKALGLMPFYLHIIDKPIEVRQCLNGKVQFGMFRLYGINENNIIYPKYDYLIETLSPVANLPYFSFSGAGVSQINSNFSKIFEYTANERGNIISAKNKAGVVTNFTWGYNDTRPTSSSTNGFNTFYEYQMPFGISKITAPDGTKTHFEYDGYGRLISIKDDDLNPVEAYEYFYADENEHYNYLKKTVFRSSLNPSGGGEQSNVPANTSLSHWISFQYCDGLGREIQTVEKAASPLAKDIVQFKRYNTFATEDKIFLPFPKTNDNSGEFMEFDDAYDMAKDYYETKYYDPNFYSEIEYESSPLFRILQTGKPGSEYKLSTGHTTKIKEGVGSATAGKYHICHLKWAGNEIVKKENYNSQPYYKEITDPDGHILIQFFEKDGRILAERKILDNKNVTLYYVYDDMFRLRAVLQPDASNFAEHHTKSHTISLSADTIRLFSYLYKYDNRGNIIEKKKPGLHDSPEYFAYDNMNRLISFRDGNLVKNNQCIDKEYDSFGRETKSYLSSIPTQHGPNYAPSVNGSTPPVEFDNSALQLSLTSNFYDGIFPDDFPEGLAYVEDEYYGIKANSNKGQLTGTKVCMPDGNICEYTAMYYDKKGRLIQQRKTNFYAGNEDFYFRYNFVGELLETKHVVHPKDNFEGYTEKNSNSIDHRGRLLSVSHQLNNSAPVLVATYQYDELGKLKEKEMFPNNPNIADRYVRYTYHIQGMLEKIESKLFEEVLIYGNKYPALRASVGSSAYFLPSYNGNISAKITRAIPDAGGGTHTIPMRDNYRYDKLDRLIADYHSGNGNQNFSVTGINYDLEGNILSLTRHGIEETQPGGGHAFEVVNQLAVVPRGVESNKTRSEVVSNDADLWASYGSQNYIPSGDFEDNLYDFNGNLLFDDMRETEFKYNHLNLATKITNPSDTMLIQYDALGNKIRQISSGDTLYFVGGSIYKNSQLYYLPLPEGYYRDGKYYAVIHDYLGSVRIVLRANDNKIQEVNHYDPFGIEYGLSEHPFGVQPFKHQGKERMNITGFSLHNHGARLADNVMGRWTTRDPLEEKDYWNGAYVYCNNNPVRYFDNDGRSAGDFLLNGQIIGNDGINDKKIYAVKTTEKSFNGVAGAGLSKSEQTATVNFIKNNSGNTEAFQNNDIAYKNSIEIESSANNRQTMVNEINKDNGNGGTKDANNREYGGSIQDGAVVTATPGAVANPKTDEANIELPTGTSTFHSHPSGTVVEKPAAGTVGGTTRTYSFVQSPSQTDINTAGAGTHYVFGRGNGMVYVYTSNGVQAVIPMKHFVNPKQ